MKDEDKSKTQLIKELQLMRHQVAALTRSAESASPSESRQNLRIPEKKRIEDALELTLFCFDTATVGIFQVAMDGRILNANSSAAKMLGYTKEELTRLSIPDIDPFIGADTVDADLKERASLKRSSFETVHIKKDGSRIPVEIIQNVFEYKGERYSVAFVQDITERKRTQESLRLAKFIFDKAPIGILRLGESAQVLDVNDEGCDSLGYTKEELCRMTVFDYAPGYTPEDWATGTAILNRGKTRVLQSQHQRKNGDVYPVQIIQNRMRFEGQDIRVAFVQDITEQKQAEASLGLAKFIIDHANVGIYRIAKEGQIIEVNQKAAQLLGYAKEELETLSMEDIDPEVLRESWEVNWQRLKVQGERTLEREHQRKDGSLIAVELHANLLQYEGLEYAIAFVQDISQRRRNEEALRKQDQLLHDIGRQVKMGAWRFDLETGKVTSTDEVSRINDLEPDRTLDIEKGLGFYHGAHRQKIKHAFNRLVKQGIPYDLELEIESAKGNRKWVRTTGDPVIRDGRVVQVQGSYQDISERKRMEESLHITRFSFDHAPVGIYLIGAGRRILDANEAAARMLGYSRKEMLTLSTRDIVPHHAGMDDKTHWNLAKTRAKKFFESFHRSKDGRDIPVEIRSNLFEYRGQRYAITFAQDITERKQDEKELRRLRNYLSNIIDSMPSVLVGVDREGRVTQWNRKAEEVTGMDSEKARSQPLDLVFPGLAREMDRIRTSIRERRVINTPKVLNKQGQKIRYEDITIYPLVSNGVEGAVIRLDDVTEQVRLEEMMIQSEKMLSVGGLAAGMAHEINNPLAGVIQTADVLSRRLQADSAIPANQKAAKEAGITMEGVQRFIEARDIPKMLDTIKASGLRMAEIVNNMLSFSRKADAMVSSHPLDSLLDKTLELASTDYDLKRQYDFKNIKILREYQKDLPPVPCEATKIQQVILNILRNGAQAMQEKGSETSCFILRTRRDSVRNMAVIEIEDNGPGMDAQTQKRIFEPFFTTKPVGVGTGLGLSVSYFIITENHKGEMTIQSSPGTGAKFIIRLPLSAKG